MNFSQGISNEVISASAGSGKTYQLTNRYIYLLSQGVQPEKIIALTFTKKAAGEIFDKIINKLWSWYVNHDDPTTAGNISKAVPGGMTSKDILKHLRKIVLSQNKIRISTLDSFFVNILQCFPMEFGINGTFDIVDDYRNGQNKETVLRQILYSKCTELEKRNFLEQFKKACYGKEEKSIKDNLDSFLNDNYLFNYMFFTSEESWRIPGCETGIITSTPQEITDIAGSMVENIESFMRVTPGKPAPKTLTQGQKTKLIEFLNEAGSFVQASEFSEDAYVIFTEILNSQYIYHGKGFDDEPEFKKLIGFLLKCHFLKYQQRTAGVYSILNQYDTVYDTLIRKNGYMSFADITYILNGQKRTTRPILTSIPVNDLDYKFYVDYRLDGHFDHWMIDEFQDTSRIQWNIIGNLADEAISNPEKSFFYVGDIKQAIYGWRGGDSLLFDYLRVKYKDRLTSRELNETRRSCPEIVEAVKTVFEGVMNHRIQEIPHETVDRWKTGWGTDEYKTSVTARGYAVLSEFDGQDILDQMISKIKEIDPFVKELSVGVLALTNDKGKEIANELRKHHIPVSLDGYFELTDSPAVNLMLSLVKFAAHPSDTLSYHHLMMSPLPAATKELLSARTEDFILEILEDISRSGFSELMAKWHLMMSEHITLNDFDSGRMRKMIMAAETFDVSGNRNCLDFINFIETYKIPAEGNKKAVQVMTVYKAKGLEFDIVFLPQLSEARGYPINRKRLDLGLNTIPPGMAGPHGLCALLPGRDVSTASPEIREYIGIIDAAHCYEKLCCLYVAMTRAKKALYMYVEPPPKSSKAVYTSTILRETLASRREYGNSMWFESLPKKEKPAGTDAQPMPRLELKPLRKIDKETPSGIHALDGFSVKIHDLIYDTAEDSCIQTGICVHYMLEQIDYLDDAADLSFSNSQKEMFNSEVWNKAHEAFIRAISDDKIARLLSRNNSSESVLWKEKSFSLMIDNGKWLSGQFDRVEIIKQSNGEIRSVRIIDYKYENASIPLPVIRARYSPQLDSYKKAVCKILNVSEKLVSTHLLLLNRLAIVET